MTHRFAAIFANVILFHAATAQDSSLGEPTAPLVASTDSGDVRTFIPHALEVKPFVPPIPAKRKALPAVRVDASVTVPGKGGTKLTLLRGETSTLPDIPPPPPPVLSENREPTPEELAHRAWTRRHNLGFGATVFDHRVSHVCWTDPDSGEFYQALCGFDIGLLAGIGSFSHLGERYSFFLIHSCVSVPDARRFARSYAARFPQLAEISPGQILVIRGDANDQNALAPIQMIGQLIDAEKDRLVSYQAARRKYADKHAEWFAAHPEPPRDETFLFKPHRGSRYLTNSRP